MKGISDDGGFLVPEDRTVYIEMNGWSNGFNAQNKSDIRIFTLSSNSDLTVRHAEFKGGENHILIPDSAKNAKVTIYGCEFFNSNGPAVYIGAKADNTNLIVQWSEYWYQNNGYVKNNSKSSTVIEEYCNRLYEKGERGGEYWGT